MKRDPEELKALAESYLGDLLFQAIKETAWEAVKIFQAEIDGLDTLEQITLADKIEAAVLALRTERLANPYHAQCEGCGNYIWVKDETSRRWHDQCYEAFMRQA